MIESPCDAAGFTEHGGNVVGLRSEPGDYDAVVTRLVPEEATSVFPIVRPVADDIEHRERLEEPLQLGGLRKIDI